MRSRSFVVVIALAALCGGLPARGPSALGSDNDRGTIASDWKAGEGDGEEWTESFLEDPRSSGWGAFGDAAAFAWDEERRALRVAWDSSRTNSYFARPLGTVLTAGDDFSLSFELELETLEVGLRPGFESTFQLAVGWHDSIEARRTNFYRGSGRNAVTGARSVVEWNYFPDTGFGATLAPSVFAADNAVAVSFTFPFVLRTGVSYGVTMAYRASDRVLRTEMTEGGMPMAPIREVRLPRDLPSEPPFDFRLDAVAIASYSDAGQAPGLGGSVLAHGWVDTIRVALPPALKLSGLRWEDGRVAVGFSGRKGWRYALERSEEPGVWTEVDRAEAETTEARVLVDPGPKPGGALYRVRGDLGL